MKFCLEMRPRRRMIWKMAATKMRPSSTIDSIARVDPILFVF